MTHNDDLQQTFSDICLLYELALAVGQSLDIKSNCEVVLTTLMARKAFSYGSVWLRSDRLPQRARLETERAGQAQLELVYGAPKSLVGQVSISLEHPIWRKARENEALSVFVEDPEFSSLMLEKEGERGSISIFALGDIGLLKLHASTAKAPLSEVELSQLVTIARKFTTSLEGCLAHARIVVEIAERERAEKERHAAEQQLQQAQKMEAVGRLAGGIAHDFNNLLVAVLGNAELLSRDTTNQPRLQSGLNAIATAARRAADLTGQLLAFSRSNKLQSTSVPIDQLVLEVVGLLSRTIDPKIRVETDLNLPASCVIGEPAGLHTVLLNLALNARDAMPRGGVLGVSTRSVSVPVPGASAGATMEGQWIEVSVSDTGVGMPADVAARVFEPFFTTKELGQGTGLGLAAAYGIVQSHGGDIHVDSRQGEGSTFHVRLRKAECASPKHAKLAKDRLFAGQGSVLLVDDDEGARRTIALMLARLGFEVIQAQNGREALAHLAQASAFAFLLVDLKMPVLDGIGMLRQLPTLARRLPIIAISGFAEEQQKRALPELGVSTVLQKPFTLEQLSRAVEHLLGAASESV